MAGNRQAFQAKRDLPNLLLDPELSRKLASNQNQLRYAVGIAMDLDLPVPAFMATLSYFDAYRSTWLPANLIQAQRDYFGAHSYERNDAKGMFHTQWET